jgi:photosystem II stability/assembly factor-like uncharacterized protein
MNTLSKRLVGISVCMLFVMSVYSQSWVAQTSGTNQNLRHVQFVNAQNGYAVGAAGTVLKTTNGGTNWTSVSPAGNSGALFIGCYFLDANVGFVGGDVGVYKTTNGGTNWALMTGANAPTGITKLWFVNANLGWAVGGVDGSSPVYGDIFKTTDGGSTWSNQHNSSTWSRFYGVQFTDASNGWAYTESNGLLIHTTDAGSTWTPQISNPSSVYLRGMCFQNANTGFVFGRTNSSGLAMKTTNGGGNWTDYGVGVLFQMGSAAFVDANNGWVLASGPGGTGTLRSSDAGLTWSGLVKINAGVPNSLCFVDANNGWMACDGGLIYKYSSATGISDQENIGVPGEFKLEQNYPNPFNPTTRISYTIGRVVAPSASEGRAGTGTAAGAGSEKTAGSATGNQSSGLSAYGLRLTVYDLLGREVAELVNGVQTPGRHEVVFNAANLASGVYVYRLTAGAFTATKTMTIVR